MNNLVLVGFSGTGKSAAGRILADELGRPFVDLDEKVAGDAARSVEDIFRQEGEPGFRRRETRCLQEVLSEDGQVVAAGGGAPMDKANWDRIRSGNCVVSLTAEPDTICARLDGTQGRPLLQGGALRAIEQLLPLRLPRYLEADIQVATDRRTPEQVAGLIARSLPAGSIDRVPVAIPGAAHEITIGRRLNHLVASGLIRSSAGAAAVITDDVVGPLFADGLRESLDQARLRMAFHTVPAGEASKSLPVIAGIYEGLAGCELGRDGALVALGGGVVGDLAGFAASTWLRGIPYLQVPTTLLSMVDSSIGGKTGVNLAAGKNLVGSFHQPVGIYCDLESLSSLPPAQYRSAFAEIIKAAVIADPDLLAWLEANNAPLLERDLPALQQAIVRSCEIKAGIVSEDPREQGRRVVLNYGHTAGHAIERALGYGTIKHGEAVALGMRVAARLSLEAGLCPPGVVQEQDRVLAAFGLGSVGRSIPKEPLLQAIRLDKKKRNETVRWVLMREPGRMELGCEVSGTQVMRALDEVLG